MLVVKMAFATWFEVEINTFTGRVGMAAGEEVEEVIVKAVDMLLETDAIMADVAPRR